MLCMAHTVSREKDRNKEDKLTILLHIKKNNSSHCQSEWRAHGSGKNAMQHLYTHVANRPRVFFFIIIVIIHVCVSDVLLVYDYE